MAKQRVREEVTNAKDIEAKYFLTKYFYAHQANRGVVFKAKLNGRRTLTRFGAAGRLKY